MASTWVELLGAGPLSVYLDPLTACGYDDFQFVLSLEATDWEDMLDTLKLECMRAGNELKAGHRVQIKAKLTKAKATRDAAVRKLEKDVEEGSEASESTFDSRVPRGSTVRGPEEDRRVHFRRQTHVATTSTDALVARSVCLEGFSACFEVHWTFCFVLSLFVLTISLLLWWLDTGIGVYSPDRDGAGLNQRNDSWEFLQAVYIIGFIIAALTFLTCVCMLLRNPESDGGSCLDDCKCDAPGCPACALPAFACFSCSGICDELRCPECDCLPSSCPISLDLPRCTCEDFCPCSLPTCYEIRAFLTKLYKIFCCRCHCQFTIE